jgi:tripartite-type tricarboxylate transporter receptor subunit TctC
MRLVPVLLSAALSLPVVLAVPSQAQTPAWPQRQIFFINPFAAGGGSDAFARPMAAQLDKQLDTRIVVENRAGAGGNTGAAAAAKAAPDGYTFFVGATHHTIAPSIYPKLAYDLEQDFVPIAMLGRPPHVIVVNPDKIKAKTLQEFIAVAKADAGKLSYGSAGNGTTHHLAGELFKLITKTEIAHVAYRGAGPAMQDLVAGHIQVAFDGLGTSASMISGGQVRALAVTAPTRNPAIPEVPTTAEAGLPGYEFATWYGLWAPKGTPADIVTRMIGEVGKALQDPSIKAAWERNGSDIPDVTGAAFGKYVSEEIVRWGKVAKDAGVKLEGG